MAAHVLKYAKFASYHATLTKNTYEKYLSKMNLTKKDSFSVMDIGCGDGNILRNVLLPLLPENCGEVIATDIDDNMLAYCKNIRTKRDVEFQKLDISTEKLPENFKNRFDVLFSAFCFMYVMNLNQALKNCSSMLKKEGEFLFIYFPKKNPLFDVYRELSRVQMWQPYLKNFRDYVSHFKTDDTLTEAKSIFQNTNLKLMDMEYKEQLFETNRRNLLEINLAMDSIFKVMPEDKQKIFEKVLAKALSDVFSIDLLDESKLDTPASLLIPVITLHGQKI